MNSAYRLTALLMGTTVMVAQPFHWGKAMAGVPIGKLAPEVTVFIQGVNNPDNFGSGVIIGRSGKSYTVLTAAHVVAAADRYTIQASDGVQYSLQNIQRLPNVDMAVVQFESSSSYTTAQLGDSDQVSLTTGVYVAGFPKPGQNIRVPVLTITNGEIAQVLPANASVDGYGLAYTNSTRAGMSGGPVFNSEGQVVAIHGRKEGEAGGGATNGAWLNLGIPINRYKTAGKGSSQVARASFVDTQQQNAREEAQRQAALEAQKKAQEQSQLAQEKAAQQQAALEAQKKAQEQAQKQAALEAQKKAQEQAQKQAVLEAQKKAQEQAQRQAALEAQKKAQEQAQRQVALEAQKKAQEQAQRQAALEVQKKSQAQAAAQQQSRGATAKAVLAAASPFSAAISRSQPAAPPSSREVCEEIRINTIVSKRCRAESVFQESASAPKSESSAENYVNSGNAKVASGSYQGAVEDYNAAIQGNSSLAIAFFNRGLAYYKLGKEDRAIADFSKAADLFRAQGDAQKLQKTQDILQSLTRANS
ncbi:trypsin-like peptidase domain-containing protein [Altericista sp. CCNU0014]|uniref:trypsin-like peptidase domain-containing protein n=1 Tax=Altericista sp. CCNU0014 TaxID=3082949 RepID=UPI0038500350